MLLDHLVRCRLLIFTQYALFKTRVAPFGGGPVWNWFSCEFQRA